MAVSKTYAVPHGDSSIGYDLYGPGESAKAPSDQALDRAAGSDFLISMRGEESPTPEKFVERGELLASANGRKNQMQASIISFPPEEFDPKNPEDVARAKEVVKDFTEQVHSADYMAVLHDDRDHLHAHIKHLNHDNLTGKALSRNTHWDKGFRQVHDQVLQEHGLRVLANPHRERDGWTVEREGFAAGGREQQMGDRIAAAQRDLRSVDVASYQEVLKEQGVKLLDGTAKDGSWRYSMKVDEGRPVRRSASKLSPDFDEAHTREVFEKNRELARQAPEPDLTDAQRERQQWLDSLLTKSVEEPAAKRSEPKVEQPVAETPEPPQQAEQQQPSAWAALRQRNQEQHREKVEEQPREEPKPQREPGQERGLGVLTNEQMKDRELIAVVGGAREDGSIAVDFQLSADDPVAKDRKGLHVAAPRDGRAGGIRLTAEQYERLRQAAGDNRTEVGDREVLAARGNLMPSPTGRGHALNVSSLKASEQPRIGPDVIQRQRASEDHAREHAGPSGSDLFSAAAKKSRERSQSRDAGMSL